MKIYENIHVHIIEYHIPVDAFVWPLYKHSWNCSSLVAWSGQVRSFGPGCGWDGWIGAWVCRRSVQETTTLLGTFPSNRELDLRWKHTMQCMMNVILSNLVLRDETPSLKAAPIYWSIRCTLTMLRKPGKENRRMKCHSSSNFWVTNLSPTPHARRPISTYCTHSRCRSSGCNEDLSIWSAGLFTHSRIKQNKLALANLLAIIAGLTNTRIICISTTAILLRAFIATVLRVNVKTGLARVSSKHDLIVVANLECQRWCAASWVAMQDSTCKRILFSTYFYMMALRKKLYVFSTEDSSLSTFTHTKKRYIDIHQFIIIYLYINGRTHDQRP